ncbi:phage tail sheath subtilisin-like domain-containing protein [Qipengyuania citrea]|uniref:phage tail sheath subtilisin-like domain-containing protein n=1 Tax=Qipengyuania citrea TaxID=225971 RepID=UPI0020A0ADCA|nr:phage tail sheath subtilisin-like domain-containing protein [Qipengyuania citrea]MCP2016849.1 phage tail sheath protein FI [Qipengyuania citrea]
MAFHHGLTLTESAGGARALGAISLAVIGIVATATTSGDAQAQADLDAAFPLDEPVLITGGVDIASGKAGDGGTLGPALAAIGDQASPVVVVVRVAEGADQEATEANVIGATDGNIYTGLQALKAAETKVGVKPRILGAPGLDSQPVAEELVAIAKALRGFAYVGAKGADGVAPADDIDEALTYRDNFDHRELMVIWPDTSQGGGDAIARALGLRAQIDESTGWHKTLSNVPLVGVTGLARDVHFDLVDPSTDAGVLNAQEVTTIIRQTGFRFWGNRTCADPAAQPEFVFESAVRTSHALQDICAQIVSPFIDKPMTIGLIKDLLETGNARFRQLAAEGQIIGAEMFFDPDVNSAQELAAGRPRFRIDFTPAAPLENPNIDLVITDFYYSGFADQLI